MPTIAESLEASSGYACLRLDSPAEAADACIVFLHGVGERGGDIRRVLDYGLPATLRNGTHSIDCTVVCPHLEAEEDWEADRLARLIDALRQRYERVVVCGFSLGASGACRLISRFGTLPHLTIVVAGRFLEGVGDVRLDQPVVFVEGEHDEWADTRDFRATLGERSAPFTHVCIPGAGHFIAEASMETSAVTDALAALRIAYRRAGPG